MRNPESPLLEGIRKNVDGLKSSRPGSGWLPGLPRVGLETFEAGETAAWNAVRCLEMLQEAQRPAWRVALEKRAERLEGLKVWGGAGQPRTLVKTDGRGVFGLEKPAQGGVALKCCKRCKGPAWRVALERLAEGLEGLEIWRVWRVWGRANGSLERP